MSESEGPQQAATPSADTGASAGPTSTQKVDGGEGETSEGAARKRRRRGSRGGRNRSKPRAESTGASTGASEAASPQSQPNKNGRDTDQAPAASGAGDRQDGGRPQAGGTASRPLPPGAPPKPKIGDTLPAPASTGDADQGTERDGDGKGDGQGDGRASGSGRRRRGGRGRGGQGQQGAKQGDGQAKQQGRTGSDQSEDSQSRRSDGAKQQKQKDQSQTKGAKGGQAPAKGDGDGDGTREGGRRRRKRGSGRGGGGGDQPRKGQPVEAVLSSEPVELDEQDIEKRRGRQRKGKAVGRYTMCVHVSEKASQIAVLEGRSMIEHYVSRPSDDVSQIHGNVYLGRVQNVLPGMEAAFVDIGTPKNAVLYRGDVHYDRDDVERSSQPPKIEKLLRAGQSIVCQVTKNPIGAKGARLTQEVSLPGRYVVLIPNSSTYGISKRLPDDERKRLRQVLDNAKPAEHGIIVRTAAEGATSEEIENDVRRLLKQWKQIDSLAKRSKAAALLYREPNMSLRVIREEFNQDYRSVVIDDRELYESVRDYVSSINSALADRVQYFDPEKEKLPLFERYHVHEQLHRALDRKVWLPSGGSLIIERTEALTVVDVNTGKNVGRSSLEETVFKNNLEAAVETARQLRLRDIGGIIVIDYIDMERRENRDEVVRVFREALSRDKTRTQVFEISELGLCEMTRKRIGEGLLESYSSDCPMCDGRGMVFDKELLPDE
jgi:ribonuclease E